MNQEREPEIPLVGANQPAEPDKPIELADEFDESDPRELRLGTPPRHHHPHAANSAAPRPSDNGSHADPGETALDPARKLPPPPADPMSEALYWALDAILDPAMASADWVARDIDPAQPSAAALITDPNVTLGTLKQAKTVFKTMRIVGEKSSDRRIGARMYAAAIAAGLVRHKQLISSQSQGALRRAFEGLLDDKRMPQSLRDLAGMALCVVNAEKRLFPARPRANGSDAGAEGRGERGGGLDDLM